MLTADQSYDIFQQSIDDYHSQDSVETPVRNPYPPETLQALLYEKNWIDTVQWHLEDLVRNPELNPADAMEYKRRIDQSNQRRTDMVELIDDRFVEQFKLVKPKAHARFNSETPAWLLDRMSILLLKIYHMMEQTRRTDAGADHIRRCEAKLTILMEQRGDMKRAFDELMEDIAAGERRFKVYRQMKMYNDESLNPVLYSQKQSR